MKRIILAVVIGCVVWAEGSFAYAESSVQAAPRVKIVESKGYDDASIGPVRFPDFYKFTNIKSSEQSCEDFLGTLSGTKMSDNLDDNGFLKTKGGFYSTKNCKKACKKDKTGSCDKDELVSCGDSNARGIDVESGEGKTGKVVVGDDDYYDLEDLFGEIEVDPGYANMGKILFSWTVRVEGNIPEDCDHYNGVNLNGLSVWPVLCHPWHGKSYQEFAGGQVKTQLYVLGLKTKDEYAAVGEPVEMTVPLIKSKVTVGSGSDPTLTGSYVLTPGDFSSGEFPDTIKYRLKWANHTALRIKSPKKQRSLVATVMPLTQ